MILMTVTYGAVPMHLCEENGRRFWSVRIPDPSGWSLAQEFSPEREAMRYVDEKLKSNADYAASHS